MKNFKKIRSTFTLILMTSMFFASPLLQAQRGNPELKYSHTTIDQMVYDFMQERNIPGLTMAIVQAPYIPRVAAYGVADISEKLPTGMEKLASTRTLWGAGPISQAYMAVALFQLYEAQKIDIRKPASTYLKSLPSVWKNITLFQLLQHASGIADYRKESSYDHKKTYTFDELIRLVKDTPLEFEPGTKVVSSATNYLLLAEVVNKTSGMNYHDYVWKNQIDRLGLKRTLFIEDRNILNEDPYPSGKRHGDFKSKATSIHPAEIAQGYKHTENGLSAVDNASPTALRGYADIYASAEDISIWDIGLAGSVLIKNPENRALIYQPTTLDNGIVVPAMAGWEFTRHPGFMDIQGSAPGYSAYLSRFTAAEDLVCVTLMANVEGIDFTELARRIAGAYDERLYNGIDPEHTFTMESAFSAKETLENIKKSLAKNHIPIFGIFDHKDNAEKVNLVLKDNFVIVFGDPSVGTYLMQETPAMSLDLPLRINVWEDKSGRVWVGFRRMADLAHNYQNKNEKIIHKIQRLLEKLSFNATHTYKR